MRKPNLTINTHKKKEGRESKTDPVSMWNSGSGEGKDRE
jgi:hypothetical protein